MKQFFLKNIVLTVVIVITLAAAGFLGFLIFQKSATIDSAVEEIRGLRDTVESINSTHKPNNVAESEKLINSDIEFFDTKTAQVYRHFGSPYRKALIAFINNIASKSELAALPEGTKVDDAFTVVEPPKDEDAEDADDEDSDDEAEKEAEEAEEEADDEAADDADDDEDAKKEKPVAGIIVTNESALREMLREVYKDVHTDVPNDSDDFVIPDNILDERYAIFAALIQKLIEPPESLSGAKAKEFKQAGVDKIARAFEIFRKEVDETTLENVDNGVAKQMFMDALGLPRLVRRLECKNFMDGMYRTYRDKDVIPGFKTDETTSPMEDDYETKLSQFIYSRLNKQVAPVADMVIPVFRNFQIKEDIVRRMNEAHIRKVVSVTPKYLPGNTTDGDPDSAILVYTYTIELQSALDEIAHFIDSLHTAYKDNRVYVITNMKFEVENNDIADANALVEDHIRAMKEDEDGDVPEGFAAGEKRKPQAANGKDPASQDAILRAMYKPDDPKHIDYGEVLIGGKRGEIACTLVVDYYLYRGDNIIPDK